MQTVNEITELSEIVMFGAGCLDINNCSADQLSTAQLQEVETYCKGGSGPDGPYGECGVSAKCK